MLVYRILRTCDSRFSSPTPKKVTIQVDARHETLLYHRNNGKLALN